MEETRKKLSKKKIAIILVVVFVLSGLAGFLIWYNGSDLKYNHEIKSAYGQVVDGVEDRFVVDLPVGHGFSNYKIMGIRFGEVFNGSVSIETIASCQNSSGQTAYIDAFYKVAKDYYYAILNAEEYNDMKVYVSALNDCFQNMEYVDYDISICSPDLEISKENAEKFNELFNLSSVQTNKELKQVGFLPQYLQIDKTEVNSDRKFEATYTIKGLSFVEVVGEEGTGILPGKKSIAIMNSKVDKNKVQVFEVDFQFTIVSDPNKVDFDLNKSYIRAFRHLLDGDNKYELKLVQVTYFKQLNDALTRMQNGTFDFAK